LLVHGISLAGLRSKKSTFALTPWEDLYEAVLAGQVDRSAAAVCNQIANSMLRAVEFERRVKEQDDLEIRLDELAGLLEEAEERSRYGGR
jgi:hypothetical protein